MRNVKEGLVFAIASIKSCLDETPEGEKRKKKEVGFWMWKISQMLCAGVLAGLSVVDIRDRKIPVNILILLSLMAVGYQISMGDEDIRLIVGGVCVGAVFLLISKATGEGMGYGDSWAVLILGIYLGIWRLIEALAGAFLILTAVSIICLCRKHMSRKCRLPFYPFLAAGYFLSITMQQ